MGNIFLIGGSDFIGENLVDYFEDKYAVHVFDKYIDSTFLKDRKKVKIFQLDLVQEQIPNTYPSPDYIINLASIVTLCEQNYGLIDVKDFVYHIGQLIRDSQGCVGEIVNVSSGMSISLREIIEKYRIELCSTSEINYGAIPYWENEIMDIRCSIDKLKDLIVIKNK